jgi:hypothetical protein
MSDSSIVHTHTTHIHTHTPHTHTLTTHTHTHIHTIHTPHTHIHTHTTHTTHHTHTHTTHTHTYTHFYTHTQNFSLRSQCEKQIRVNQSEFFAPILNLFLIWIDRSLLRPASQKEVTRSHVRTWRRPFSPPCVFDSHEYSTSPHCHNSRTAGGNTPLFAGRIASDSKKRHSPRTHAHTHA